MSTFNVKDFQSGSNDSGLDDVYMLHPEGEFTGQIPTDPDQAFSSNSGEKDNGSPWAQLTIKIETLDPMKEIEGKLFRKPQVTDRFFLDLTPEGSFDYARQRNVRVGQYLSATNNNKGGWKFTDLCGKQIKFKVVHVKSDLDPTRKVTKVTTLGRAA